MIPTVTVANFEGPLGLLLELIEQGELEVTAIAVGTITRQYLDRVSGMSELGRQDLSHFLELGARLVYIKSLALLPDTANDEAPLAELRQLNRELTEYRLFQTATGQLRARLAAGQQSYIRTSVPKLSGAELPTPDVSLVQLGALFSSALERSRPAPETLVIEHLYDQTEIAEHLRQQTKRGELVLSDIITGCRDRTEIIVTFLAILDLIRSEQVIVRQGRPFDDMILVGVT